MASAARALPHCQGHACMFSPVQEVPVCPTSRAGCGPHRSVGFGVASFSEACGSSWSMWALLLAAQGFLTVAPVGPRCRAF